ncbi:MAG: YggT family protein, partial [Acidimicrobiales bacterium]
MDIICWLLTAYVIVIVVRIILTYFPLDPDGGMAVVAGFLYMLTDPVLRPLRRALPPVRLGGFALDLSPM